MIEQTERLNGVKRQKNKHRILTSATEEFVQLGYSGASIKRIAERAELPRANVHYYFENKAALYNELLNDILEKWNQCFGGFSVNDDPKTALSNYIKAKVQFSMQEPDASKIFAMEIIQGAPFLKHYLNNEFKHWVDDKVTIINQWQEQGRISSVNAHHLLFLIWSTTQHYADFSIQVAAAQNKTALTAHDFDQITASLTLMVLKIVELD